MGSRKEKDCHDRKPQRRPSCQGRRGDGPGEGEEEKAPTMFGGPGLCCPRLKVRSSLAPTGPVPMKARFETYRTLHLWPQSPPRCACRLGRGAQRGAGWKITAPPLSSGFIYGLAIHPENKCALFATNGRQIFKSDDCNRSWLEMYREADNTDQLNSVAINPFSPFEIEVYCNYRKGH